MFITTKGCYVAITTTIMTWFPFFKNLNKLVYFLVHVSRMFGRMANSEDPDQTAHRAV